MREALITARLQHPGVVPVHDAGRRSSGAPYYVMKLVDGRSLRKLIGQQSSLLERLELLPSVLIVVETIAYAHSRGVIHRDIKPANVMVGEFGETVVIDWGLAADRRRVATGEAGDPAEAAAEAAVEAALAPSPQAAPSDDSSQEYTVAGKVIGTPPYMSPEQARGGLVGEPSDVYALGALLYEVIAGAPPYRGVSARTVIGKVLAGPPVPLAECEPDAPPELLTIVAKAMAREPEQRYAGARQLAEELRRYQSGGRVAAHHYSIVDLVVRWLRRHRSAAMVAASLLAVMAVMAAVGVRRIVSERNQARYERGVAEGAQQVAETAQHQGEQRERELIELQAHSMLGEDPTAALAWLSRRTWAAKRSIGLVPSTIAPWPWGWPGMCSSTIPWSSRRRSRPTLAGCIPPAGARIRCSAGTSAPARWTSWRMARR